MKKRDLDKISADIIDIFSFSPLCSSQLLDKLKKRGYEELLWKDMYDGSLLPLEKSREILFNSDGTYELNGKRDVSPER